MKKYTDCFVRLVAALTALHLVLVPFIGSACGSCFGAIGSPGILKVVSVTVGLVIAVAVVSSWFRVRRENSLKILTLHTEEGTSSIAIGALQGIIRDELCKASDVHDVEVKLSAQENSENLHCFLSFKLDSQPDIPSRIDEHKQTVCDALVKLIPSQKELKIDCRVDSIVVAGKPGDKEKQSDADAFSGPVYPVSGGEENDSSTF